MPDAPALAILASVRSALRLDGALAEAGVFMGGSARLICAAKGQAPLHLFDVFHTLHSDPPPRTGAAEQAIREHFGAVHSTLEQVRGLLSAYPEVHFHPGLFPGTAAAVADKRFCFVHLDLDLAQGTRDALEFFYPRLLPGGVLIGDDYDLAEVRDSFEAFFEHAGDTVIRLPWNQAMVVKGAERGAGESG